MTSRSEMFLSGTSIRSVSKGSNRRPSFVEEETVEENWPYPPPGREWNKGADGIDVKDSLTERTDADLGSIPSASITERARFCHFGDGCSESRWVGGNYGSPVCHNPAHHQSS